MLYVKSNRHFETCAPSSFWKYFATHNSVRLCPEELKSTFNYCGMPVKFEAKNPHYLTRVGLGHTFAAACVRAAFGDR